MANELTKAGGAVAATDKGGKIAIAANKIADIYLSDVTNLNAAVGMPMTDESKRCGVNAILFLCGTYGAQAVQSLPKEQLVQVLQFVTINGLDVNNGQVFMDVRKNKMGQIVSVKATPMGNAYEIMTKRFGVDVKTIHPARVVHEGDEFTMPQFDGLKMTNVQFKPTLKGLDGKAIAVYYLIEKVDGTLDCAIATREGVAKNLMAQILNATLRKEGEVNRGELMKRMEGKTLDDLLNDEYFLPWISPAYRSPASRETMIVTKMKKNALLHYTRDLGSKAYASVSNNVEEAEKSDMLNNGNVVAYEDGEAQAAPVQKIADFDVDEESGELTPTAPVEEKKPEPVKVQPEAVEEPAKPQAKQAAAPKPEPISIFDDSLDDL